MHKKEEELAIALSRLVQKDQLAVWVEYFLTKSTESRNKLVLMNMGLIYWSINRYGFDTANKANSLQDAGVRGLAKAIERFDFKKGARFATFAPNWIKKEVGRQIDTTESMVRFPQYVCQLVRSFNRLVWRYSNLFGHAPSDRDLAELLEYPDSTVARYREFLAQDHPVSLHAPLRGYKNAVLADVLMDESPDLFNLVFKNEFENGELATAIASLSSEDRDVLLDFAQGSTPNEIAEEWDIDAGEVRSKLRLVVFKLRRKLGVDASLPIIFRSSSEKENESTHKAIGGIPITRFQERVWEVLRGLEELAASADCEAHAVEVLQEETEGELSDQIATPE